ncbi:TetR family transcriptional regulator [Mycobacterium colombiense]|uniref:TetR family transcriptional regulator n=1 Tax=Mycobacterium colombiense TaxID=339268 RepID=A0A1A2YGR3_9MYCO|nr:TetR family transcriptional regulator [Mycobacterium colombiense]
MPRRRDGQERRRELCDAAIEVLGQHGSRGLTHQQVDRCAGVAEGTTSYYYRTREALLRGVGHRVADIDRANLESLLSDIPGTSRPFARLAQLVMMQSDGQGLMLNKARHELLLASTRDQELVEISRDFTIRVFALAADAIAGLQLASEDRDLRDKQTTAVMTVIAGLFTRFISGDTSLGDPVEVEELLESVVAGIAITHGAATSVDRAAAAVVEARSSRTRRRR